MRTMRMTMGQALVKFLDNQYLSVDGIEAKFVQGVFGIFGHGCVLGIGEALQEQDHTLKYYRGQNEQGIAHTAIAFAKQNNNKKIMAVTSSIGPGAMNLMTAAALASVNRIPVLLLPGDVFACRQPDPVLQQLEQYDSAATTANNAFEAVCRYWDRISRPEQLISAAINAMRVLTDPATAGAVCLSLPQDVQAEAYDYPESFFEKRVHYRERSKISEAALKRAVGMILESKKPYVICGGGVRYSEAGDALARFCDAFQIPFGETQAGKSSVVWDHPMNLGGIGVTGNPAANRIAMDADLIIGVGTRFSDFTTCSKWLFKNENARFMTLNVNAFDAHKMNAIPFVCDAREGIEQLYPELVAIGYRSGYAGEIREARTRWSEEVAGVYNTETRNGGYSQMRALGLMNDEAFEGDAIVVGASGSLPGDMQRFWRARQQYTYHMEYGFSCMGYEVCGALGVKLAAPDKEVYAMVGDGSFVMLHSELLTSLQERKKINIMLFDNKGFGCIDKLQRSQGIPKFGCELKYRNEKTGRLDEGGEWMNIDFAKIAEGYGCRIWRASNSEELRKAIEEAKKSPVSTLIDIKVDFDSMSDGYDNWWRVGTPEVSKKKAVELASEEIRRQVENTRKY